MEPPSSRSVNAGASRWCVAGRVQGVGFRAFVVRVARSLNLDGYVRNSEDGTVDVWAEGPEPALERLTAELRRGPAHSHVTSVERVSAVPTGSLTGFEVRG